MVEEFIRFISERSVFQKKYLQNWQTSDREKEDLEQVLRFFMREEQCSLETIADAYLFINNMVLEEQYYFVTNGEYRNTTFEEVNKMVYQNKEYMTKYMMGLTISDFIWVQHLKIILWFKQLLENLEIQEWGTYLEIGPGFGQYLRSAMALNKFKNYLAVDISPVSVTECCAYLKYTGLWNENCRILQKDFFEFSNESSFEYIVMGEVLEHVENPLEMLCKIHDLLAPNGFAFVTTVINSPAIDHIYLFRTVEEVIAIAERAGFYVENYICETTEGISLDTAIKRKLSINIAMLLRHRI